MKKLISKTCIPFFRDGTIQCGSISCPKSTGIKRDFDEGCFTKHHNALITIFCIETGYVELKISTELSNAELRNIIRSKLGETCTFI